MQLRLSSSCSCCLFKPLLSLRFECCKRLHVIYSFSKSFMKINPPRAKSFKSFIKYVTPNIFPFLQCLIFSSSLGFSLGKRRAAPFFSQALTLGLRSQWHRWGLAAWRGVNANGVHDQTKGVLQAPNCLGIDGKHHLLPTFFFRTRRKCKTVEKGRDNSKKNTSQQSYALILGGICRTCLMAEVYFMKRSLSLMNSSANSWSTRLKIRSPRCVMLPWQRRTLPRS